jgi:hypothetical protein
VSGIGAGDSPGIPNRLFRLLALGNKRSDVADRSNAIGSGVPEPAVDAVPAAVLSGP